MENWKIKEREGRLKKSLKSKLPLLGKKVRVKGRRKWEEGIITIANFENNAPEYFVKYSEDDLEQLCCLPFEIYDDLKKEWGVYPDGSSMFFEITDEEYQYVKSLYF